MFRNQPKYKYIYLVSDIIILVISFMLCATFIIPKFWYFQKHNFDYYYSYFSLLLMVLVIYLFCFIYNDLYKRNIILSKTYQAYLILKSLIISGILCFIIIAIYNVNFFAWRGKDFILVFLLGNIPLFLLSRLIIGKGLFNFLIKRNILKRNLLIVGGDEAGKKVFKSLRRDKVSDINIVGFMDDYKNEGEIILQSFHNLGKLDQIKKIIKKYKVDEILIAIDNIPYDRVIFILEKCLQVNMVVRIYSNFFQVLSKKIKVEYYSNIPIIMLSQFPLQDMTWFIKRIIDIFVALFLIIVLSPLFLFIGIGIKLSSKGPVIFKQTRIGKNGRPFKFYKFRSMLINSDNTEHQEFVKNVWFKKNTSGHLDDKKIYRLTDDPRIFKFGKFIRKSSLDELPQLFNVIKGDMSLVGPRPCMPFEWEMYEEWHKNRINILPGCTGLWQALGRASVSFEEMVILDLYYISNMTLWLDLKIIINTIPVILFGKGGY
jgi:undecaprenyl-phosphate galactose phosphotransferase